MKSRNGRDIFSLRGKCALVTGGGQGLGKAIAQGFGQFGATVGVVDINFDLAEETAEVIRSTGGQGFAFLCDVSEIEQVKETVNEAIGSLGRIDILGAIAGIADRNPAEDMTIVQWANVMKVNLDGVWHVNQEVGRHMIHQGIEGSIINMASIAGQVGLTTGNANYAASKGGVIALTRCLAIEWARYNIRVNAIAPVQFYTPLVIKLIEQKPETMDYFLENIPLGRLGKVEEIIGPAIFLASEASSMVTGIVLNVDGGHTAR